MIISFFKLYYYIFHKILHILFYILFSFFLYKYLSISSSATLIHMYYDHAQIPSIKIIVNYFQYKTNYLIKSHEIYVSFTTSNNSNFVDYYKHLFYLKLNVKKTIVDTKAQFFILPTQNEYIPSNKISSYIPHELVFYPSEQALQPISIPVSEPSRKFDKPVFVIEIYDIKDTVIGPPDIINNDLPFEAPIIITVDDSSRNMNAVIPYNYSNDMQVDMLMSVLAPSHIGIKLYNDDEVFQMHINISDYILNKLKYMDHIDSMQAIDIIRSEVKTYITNSNLLVNVTAQDLRNTNNIFNLLIYEFVINSMIITSEEQFVMSNIVNSLIVELLSHINGISSDEYYNNENLYTHVRTDIILRFTPQFL